MARLRPRDQHRALHAVRRSTRRSINQRYITSWNNKQARGYRAADDNCGFSSVYRSKPLDDRIDARHRTGGAKMSLAELVDAMEDAGTVDLRGDKVLPLGAARARRASATRRVRDAVAKLRAWQRRRRAPARPRQRRRLRARRGDPDHGRLVAALDARRSSSPRSASDAVRRGSRAHDGLDNEPNNHGDHLGSAYQDGWYGYATKDLRTVLGRRVTRHATRASTAAAASSTRCRGGAGAAR